MAVVTLGGAAKLTGLSKSSLSRAVKTGRLSATRDDAGSYQVDTSELFRVYAPAPLPGVAATDGAPGELVHHAPPDATAALLEAQVESLKAMADLLHRQADDLRSERDRWQQQADEWRTTAQRLLGPPAQPPRRWWRWRRAG